MCTLLGNKVIDCFDVERFFCLSLKVCMLHQWVYQLFDTVLFGVVVMFLEIPFCVVQFGIKTYVTTFKFLAGVNREFIWELIFCLCNNFFCYFLVIFVVFFVSV